MNAANGGDYYFGYGTLLKLDEMLRYCPGAKVEALAGFANHRLEFWAYAEDRVGCHMVRLDGHTAYGVVYWVPTDELADLDTASGVDRGWFERTPIEVTTLEGEPMVVTTYFLTDPKHPATPADAYSGLVRDGLHTEGLPASFVTRTTEYLDALPPVELAK